MSIDIASPGSSAAALSAALISSMLPGTPIVSAAAYYQSADGANIVPSIQRAIAATSSNDVIIQIPPGNWVTSPAPVSPGAKSVNYRFDKGASIDVPLNLSGPIYRLNRTLASTYGTYDKACGSSTIVNATYDQPAQVIGLGTPSAIANYTNRDSVARYVSNYAPAILLSFAVASFTTTTVVPSVALTSAQIARLKVGMIIDTSDATKYSGFITSWDAGGASVTVSGWFQVGNTAAGQTPAGSTVYVNPITKIWGHNTVVTLDASSYGSAAAGYEMDVINNKAEYDPNTATTPKMWGYDTINLGTYRGAAGYISRGNFYNSFESTGAYNAAFQISQAAQDPSYGFYSKQTTGTPFAYNNGGTGFRWKIDSNGYGYFGDQVNANGINISGAATGLFSSIKAAGVDPVTGIEISGQGIGSAIYLGARTGPGNEALRVYTSSSQVNQVRITGGVATAPPIITVGGSDANIDIYVLPLGTGKFRIGYASTAAAVPTNFIASRTLAIKDSSGTVYYLPLATATW